MKIFLPAVLSVACVPWFSSCAPSPVVSLPASANVAESSSSIVEYCRLNKGRKVGDGECWSLANEAFKATGKKRPGSNIRVWGRVVDYQNEGVMPGDIMEFESAFFISGNSRVTTGPHHTAVVMQGGKGMITIAEQNFMGMKKIVFRHMLLTVPRGGKMIVYRPA